MTKPDLVCKNRKNAIHWIRAVSMDTALFGKVDANGVACGVALDAAGWTGRVTKEVHLVTCRSCHEIAHPKDSGMF